MGKTIGTLVEGGMSAGTGVVLEQQKHETSMNSVVGYSISAQI